MTDHDDKIIFLILRAEQALEPSATMSYADVVIGLPTMITCVQMVPFSLLFLYAYKTEPYQLSRSISFNNPQQYHTEYDIENERFHQEKRYQGGTLGLYAWLAFFNALELAREVKSTFYMTRGTPIDSEYSA